MPTLLNPYIGFRDNARQAAEFYHSVFGGKLDVTTFKDFDMAQDPSEADKVMHATLTSPHGLVLMLSDTPNSMPHTPGDNFSVSLSGNNDAELRGYWDKLTAGGDIRMPLDKAPWGDIFGMCTDRFGVTWMVSISPAA